MMYVSIGGGRINTVRMHTCSKGATPPPFPSLRLLPSTHLSYLGVTPASAPPPRASRDARPPYQAHPGTSLATWWPGGQAPVLGPLLRLAVGDHPHHAEGVAHHARDGDGVPEEQEYLQGLHNQKALLQLFATPVFHSGLGGSKPPRPSLSSYSRVPLCR